MTAKRSSEGWRGSAKRTPFEWALLLVSLAATLAVVIGLVVSGLTGPSGPADLRVNVADAGDPASGGRPLEITVDERRRDQRRERGHRGHGGRRRLAR